MKKNKEKKYLVSVSGGKDSTACLVYMLDNYRKSQIIPYFCDTGWEHPKTYEYLRYLEDVLKVEIVRLQNIAMEELCKKKKFFPSSRFKFCTNELKIKPAEKFIKSCKENYKIVNVVGVRQLESQNREKENLWKTNFMGNSPAKYFTKKRGKVYSKKALRKYYAEDNTVTTYQPFVYKSAVETVKYSLDRGVKINPLYDKGHKRVGCYPCIFASKNDITIIEQWAKKRLENLEFAVSSLNKKGKAYFFYGKNGLKASQVFNRHYSLPLDLECVNVYGQCE